jgi:hypothetical protein
VLLLDKASRRTAGTAERLATELGIERIWLPPRTAKVSPQDRFWRCGQDRICAHRQPPDIDAQAEMFVKYLAPACRLNKLSGRPA